LDSRTIALWRDFGYRICIMPNRDEMLAGLQLIANRAEVVASLWHILVFMALLAVAAGWRPLRKTIALLLVGPILSVAVVAWIHRNPFNGSTFTALALALAILGWRVPAAATPRPPRWTLWLGVAMTAFGLIYPHFLSAGSVFWYLYSAPTGLLPCPTLSFAIGIALVTDGLGARAWTLVLALAGLCYGLFGVLRLGVVLDVGLVLGAAALLARGIAGHRAAT
jgi:uncharacterized membrane protein